MYILKIKGKVNIPDYVQLRDNEFTLLAYFRADRPEKALKKIGMLDKVEDIRDALELLEFGKIKKIEL